jgi:SNF2 family DNA or RNA helicase
MNKGIIKSIVGTSYYNSGLDYYQKGKVQKINITQGQIEGVTEGNYGKNYEQIISITADDKFIGCCTCSIGFDCKHVAAVMFEFIDEQEGAQGISYQVNDWFDNYKKGLESEEKGFKDQRDRLIFIVSKCNYEGKDELKLEVKKVYVHKDGSLSQMQEPVYDYSYLFNSSEVTAAEFLTDDDIEMLQEVHIYNNFYMEPRKSTDLVIEKSRGGKLLSRLIKTKKLYYETYLKNEPIKKGVEKQGELYWRKDLEYIGMQNLYVKTADANDVVYFLNPAFYYNEKNNEIGEIKLKIEKKQQEFLCKMPAINSYEAELLSDKIKTFFPKEIPLLKSLKVKKVEKIIPIIRLKLLNLYIPKRITYKEFEDQEVAAVQLFFDYGDGESLSYGGRDDIKTINGDEIQIVERNIEFEDKAYERLEGCDLQGVKSLNSHYYYKGDKAWFFLNIHGGTDLDHFAKNCWMGFLQKEVPKLKRKKWQVEIADDFLIDYYEVSDEWYTKIDEDSSNEWFDIDVGIEIDGEKRSLLPILMNLFKKTPYIFEQIEKMKKSEKIYAEAEDGKMIVFPVSRVRHILLFLRDIMNKGDGNGLKISKYDALHLAELDAADKANKIRWFGGGKILDLGKKLKDFKQIKSVKMPKINVELRDYQKQGLDWLEFLKEYSLSGILADDMGLGKTIQAVAYMVNQPKKSKPFLIVAPTSVIYNWFAELERIAPKLKVLLLHGAERHDKFKDIKKYDVILSTYPLLFRDKEKLLEQEFHTVILDEAQYIKNSKSKVTLIAGQIKAEHRFCLTGTPIENHLGELWSMFNFLMPGYLGSEKKFNVDFRNPIEKYGNQEKSMLLSKKIKPFVLRRTKEKILDELPAKTEIIRHVELDKKQRDLYEAVRSLTFKEIREEIKKKGLGRSHIKILEALLRLRQICCDPRISKLEQAKKVKNSAKFEHLMEMLPNLIEEGRRVLLFSQFTSMLALIEDECEKKGIKYVKLTGSTKDRKTPVEDFQAGKVPLFLISLRAGGTGLNLTNADVVIHYDPWWNPAVENQATDRAHRIGQRKHVFVYKLITKNTVEEKIVSLQEKKKGLADNLLTSNKKGGSSKLSAEDIESIFT